MGSGVYTTAATAAIGMVLSAKEDNLPDCVSAPERPEAVEQEMVEVEVTDETPLETLFAPEEFGDPVEQVEKPKKTKKVKVAKPEKTGIFSIFWKNMEGAALKIYDKANQEQETK